MGHPSLACPAHQRRAHGRPTMRLCRRTSRARRMAKAPGLGPHMAGPRNPQRVVSGRPQPASNVSRRHVRPGNSCGTESTCATAEVPWHRLRSAAGARSPRLVGQGAHAGTGGACLLACCQGRVRGLALKYTRPVVRNGAHPGLGAIVEGGMVRCPMKSPAKG